jgi:alcohol dehydrogenase
MQALQLESPKTFRYIDIPSPGPPGPGEALVRVHRVGVCGTDIGGYLGKMPFFSYPRIPGHELGVEILALGDGVSNHAVGDRCAVEPYLNCQRCYSCQRGLTNCCEHHKTLGVMCDGGLTETILLPARKLHPSKTLTMEQLALVETLAIGKHAVDRSGCRAQESLLLIGAGPIGMSVLEFAKLAQAHIAVLDLSQDRLMFVQEKMGIDTTIRLNPSQPDLAIDQVRKWTDGRMADVVIDATGSAASMATAMEYCAFGGRLVYVGITQANLEFPHAPIMHRRELTLLASRNARSSDFPEILRAIEAGKIDTVPWITHQATFHEAAERFPEWVDPANKVIKAIISMT